MVQYLLLTIALALGFSACGISSSHLHPVALDGGEWPTVGGSLASGGVAHSASPLQVDGLLWQSKTGGVATSEPSVRDGLLYHAGRDRRIEVYDALTGERKYRDRYNGPVTGVVPTDSTFVFVTDQNERRLFDFTNSPVKERWRLEIPISASPPRVLSDGSVIVAALHGRLIRIASDGSVMWDIRTDGPIQASPAIADSLMIVATGRVVAAMRLSDGSEVWSHLTSGAVMATPAVSGTVYVGSTDSLLYALDLESGRMDWFFSTNGQLLTTPAIGDSVVYLAANDRNVYAINRRTGKKIWSYDTGGPANQSPTLAGNTLLVSTTTARLVLLDASSGKVIREFPLNGPAATRPVVAHNRVYVEDTHRRLYCFGAKSED